MSKRKPKFEPNKSKSRGWTRRAELAASDHRFFCKSTLVKVRGWTESLISQLLGEPDHYAVNPHGPNLPRMHQYERARVVAAEGTDTFRRREQIAEELIECAKTQPIELMRDLSREDIEAEAADLGLTPLEVMRVRHSQAARVEEDLQSRGADDILRAVAHERFLLELQSHYPWIPNPLSPPPTQVLPKQGADSRRGQPGVQPRA